MATVSARISSSASGYMIFTAAAKRHARRARELDNIELAPPNVDAAFVALAGDLIDTSLAAVLAASSSMEATTNELFLAHRLGLSGQVRGLDPKIAATLSNAWNTGVEKLGVIEKAGLVSVLSGRGPLDVGANPMQAGSHLISLRNELVHHKPKWIEHGRPSTDSPDRLERSLSSLFPKAAIWGNRGVAFRWNGCLGAGCAEWAAATSEAFNHMVYELAGAELQVVQI